VNANTRINLRPRARRDSAGIPFDASANALDQ